MHELGIAEGILQVTCNLAGERVVRRVTVRVGELQAVSTESLSFGFEVLAQGTVADGATLVVLPVRGDEVLVDEIELDGDPPSILRRPGLRMEEESRELEGRHAPSLHRAPQRGG